MNFSALFIKKPVMTLIVMMAILLFGILAYFKLPVSELPDVDFPTVIVMANLPGASPEIMANTVASPLEKNFTNLQGLSSMISSSTLGSTQIVLQFSLDRNIDAAAQDVQSAIFQTSRQLPSNMPNQPTVREFNPADFPVMYIALTAAHSPITKVSEYVENNLLPQLSMIDGVGSVNVFGARDYAVRIHVNPYALYARGLDLTKLVPIIQNLNANQALGTLQTEGYYRLITANGQLNNAEEFGEAVIANTQNKMVRLKDVARVENSVDNDKIITTYNGEPAVVLGIIRQTDGNTVALEKNILEALPALEKSLPSGLHLTVVNDQAQFVKAAVHDVQWTLVFAAILVVLVIFLFLNEASSTLIAVVSLPLSVIGTFALMHLFNYSLDNLSLMGLVLAVGFIIDDAVVVIENIMRHLENGMTRLKAALLGSKEIGFTVLAMTLSLVAVFIPIFFMGGIIGRLFSEFAGVVGIAILMSAVIALTLIPMLASRYLSVTHYGKSSFFTRYLERVRNTYIKSLQVALRYKKTVLSIGLLFCVGSFFLFNIIPKSFIPGQDTNILFASVQAPQGVTFEEFRQRQSSVAKLILKNKNVVGVISSIGQGQGGVSGSNVGRLVISLVPKEDRQDNIQTILTNLRNAVQNIQGLQINFMNPPSIRIGGKSNSSNYPFVLQGMDWKSLQEGTQSLEKSIKTLPGVTDIQDDLQMNNPELEVSILKDKAAQLGITPSQIESALYYAYGQSQISTIMQGTGEYDVIIDIDPRYQKNINDISHLSLTNAAGQSIPLNAVATFSETTGPLVINHYGQMPAVTLSFNLDKGVSLSQVADKIQTLAKTTLPPGVTGTFSGAAKTFSDSFATLPLLLLLTVIIIYMVLAILYESFIHPLTILTALPFAFFGALLSLFILHQPLDLFSFIGLIMLVGLTKKNGIMMVDFALTQRPQLSAEAAIVEACLVRFRPIMMTTMAAILATLPIALGLGAGGESRQALGVCVVGGLLFSQFITLYITPVIFVYLERWRK